MIAMKEKLDRMWTSNHSAYLSHYVEYKKHALFGGSNIRPTEFPSLFEWIGRRRGFPDESTLLKMYSNAYYKPGSAGCGVSKDEWRTRQLQSVEADGPISIDHTFDAAKAFNETDGTQVLRSYL